MKQSDGRLVFNPFHCCYSIIMWIMESDDFGWLVTWKEKNQWETEERNMSERKKGETFKDGFVYAGEFRKPKPNEWFVSTRIVAFPLAEDVAVQNTHLPI